MGERVCAVIVPRAGHSFDLAAARGYFAAAGVARQKTPGVVLLVDELPRTPAGKIQKFALRTLALTSRTEHDVAGWHVVSGGAGAYCASARSCRKTEQPV